MQKSSSFECGLSIMPLWGMTHQRWLQICSHVEASTDWQALEKAIDTQCSGSDRLSKFLTFADYTQDAIRNLDTRP
ncbi:hypothetical protein C7B82_19985 [Stenomitos frigidus ULC18]|uniref:Uncharacterized protein n=1 Tax=Stenomitos frigidus ULC18 TaxID=2107698 RepID=A0A2T1E0V5_9CYAN|nr:hypothetical protein C7B82_19985 [Stenomitos frigidus ULC18]